MRPIALLLSVGMFVLISCTRDGINIYAPAAFAGGQVYVDGVKRGDLSETEREYRWRGWGGTKKELSSPPRSESSLFLPGVARGKHRVRIEKTGYQPIEVDIEYGGAIVDVEIDDSLVVEAKGQSGR